MNETSRDIRYRQTEEDLRDAFELLCLKKDPQKITVAEMAERTGVTRSTFYNHYTDMPTLIMKIEDDILDEIFSMLDGCRAEGTDSRKLFFRALPLYQKERLSDPNAQPAVLGTVHRNGASEVSGICSPRYEPDGGLPGKTAARCVHDGRIHRRRGGYSSQVDAGEL